MFTFILYAQKQVKMLEEIAELRSNISALKKEIAKKDECIEELKVYILDSALLFMLLERE